MEFRPAGEGAAVTVGNVYEPFLGACHRFDIFVDRLLDGYTVAEASWMSMPVLSWQGLVFGDPLYRPYARMKDMDVEPTEEDRYFQGGGLPPCSSETAGRTVPRV